MPSNHRRLRTTLLIPLLLAGLGALAQDDGKRRAILPDQIAWKAAPAIPGAAVAFLYGDPRKPGLYTTRVKLPKDFKILPHSHPDERVYTVISGEFFIGYGNTFDPDQLKGYPPGAVFVVPAGANHFHWSRSGESIVQITGIGPSATDFADGPTKD